MRKFLYLFLAVAVFSWAYAAIAEVPAEVQTLLDKTNSGVQLTPAEKGVIANYLAMQSPAPPSGGGTDYEWGPDGFGYTAADPANGGEAFNWIDITTTGTEIWGGTTQDDTWLSGIPMGMTFPFYGTNYTTIDVSANVFMSFGAVLPSYNMPLPSTYLRICPWNQDMYHRIYSRYYYQAFNANIADVDTFVMSFHDADYYSGGGTAFSKTLQAVLFSDGRVKFQYDSLYIISPGTPTNDLGIDDAGAFGLSVGRNVSDDYAISFYPPPAPAGIYLSNPTVSPAIGNTATTFTYSVLYRNTAGTAPTVKDVYIDGSPFVMTDPGGNYVTGVTMTYATTLTAGVHNYYFDFGDGTYTKRAPLVGTFSGPTVYAPFSGIYDIGGGANNFPTPIAAVAALSTAGMSGPVTFDIYTGTYNGQINLLNTIPGLSATNTLTFRPGPGQAPVITSTSGHGFYITGADYITIRDLTITNCYYNGIYNYYTGTDSAVFNRFISNYIYNVGTGGSYSGINLYRSNDCEVIGNEILGDSYGLYVYYSRRNLIANNMIYGTLTYGIYAYYGDYNNYYHNTLYVGAGSGLYKSYGTYTNVVDNIIYQAGTGSTLYAYYLVGAPATYFLTSNYNDLYAPTANVGYYTVAQATLLNWQTATGLDANSISANPNFYSTVAPYNFHIITYLPSPVDNVGTPLAAVTSDFDGEPRSALAPDIGADEFTYMALDYCVDLTPRNMTQRVAPTQFYNYSFNIFNCGTTNDTYNLALTVTGQPWPHQIRDNTGTTIIDSIQVAAGATNSFIVRVLVSAGAAPGAQSVAEVVATSRYGSFDNILTDTSFATTTATLGGNYDIGGGANNFVDLVSAATALNSFGVGLPVTFNIYTGTFNGQVNLTNTIPGMGASNPITFRPAAGQSPVVTSTSGHGFYITGADYITIRGLEISNCYYNGIYNYYTGTDSAKFNRFIGNHIYNVGTGSTNAGINLYYSTDCEVTGNEIQGDYYGLYVYYASRNTIANNMIYGTGMYGIYLYYGNYNNLYYNSLLTSTTYGLYKGYGNYTNVINNIFFQNGAGTVYAYYLLGAPATYFLTSNYNDLYAPTANVGYYLVAQATLANWQAATLVDANSISADPGFTSLTDTPNLHIYVIIPSPVDGAATPLAAVTTDFDGQARNAVTPDIGADEFTFVAYNYCVNVEPEFRGSFIEPGDSVTYLFTVNNCGVQNDTYDLTATVTGDLFTHRIMDKTASSVISTIAVNAGVTDTFLVRVNTEGFLLGDTSFCEVVAQSGTVRDILQDTVNTRTILSAWVEINPNLGGLPGINTGLLGDDSNLGPFPIGFLFPYYDCVQYNSIRVCTNGFASFTSTSATYTNVCIPSPSAILNLVAPYWDDMYVEGGTDHSVWYYYDAPRNRFIVEWDRIRTLSYGGVYTFELVLNADGSIRFMYKEVTHGLINASTVGIQDGAGVRGIQYTCNGSGPTEPVTGLIIDIPTVCEEYCVSLTPTTMTSVVSVGDSNDYTVNIANCGSQNDTYDLTVGVTGQAWQTEIWDALLTSQIDSIVVAGLSSSSFKLRVVVPGGASQGQSSTAAIAADSRYGTLRNTLTDTSWATTTAVVPITLPYFENFDLTNGGYAASGTALWEWGIPTAGPGSAYSPPNCWGTILAGLYPNNACGYLTTPIINMTAPATLTFRHWYDTETNWDWGLVQISTDGGGTWATITPVGGYPGTPLYGNACLPNQPSYMGNSGGWLLATFDLSVYTGMNVMLRWTFGSDGSVQYPGWYVDDVAIAPMEDWCVNVDPETQTSAMSAGGSVDFPMSATNCGVNQDVYSLSALNVPTAWTGSFFDATGLVAIDSVGPLNNMQTADFIFRLTSPVGELPGTYSANAIATSRYGSVRNTLADTVQVQAILCAVYPLPYSEDFEWAGADPPCWTIVDGGSMVNGPGTWHAELYDPGNPTLGWMMISDSDAEGSANTQDEQLISPTLDCTGVPVVFLSFWHLFDYLSDVAAVDISVAGGVWQNIVTYSADNTGTMVYNISAWAANQSDIRIRFHYISAWGWWWLVDSVRVYEGVLWADAATTCIRVTPLGTVVNDGAKKMTGTSYNVYATVENMGTVTGNITVNAMDDLGWASTTTIFGMVGGTCQEVLFPLAWIGGGGGAGNTMTVFTVMAGDTIPGNNTATKSVTVPGADGDTLMVDDGTNTYANAWYYYDVINVMATEFTPTLYPVQINWLSAWMIGPGSVYWPWPDATTDQWWISIWLEDPMNPGYPAEPPVWTEHCMYSSGVLEGWAYVAPDEPVMVTSGSFWIGVQNPVVMCASVGQEGLAMDAVSNFPLQAWVREAGTWMNLDYYTGDDLVRANVSASLEPVLVTIRAIGANAVLDWASVPGAVEYKIYKASVVGGPYALIDSTSGTQYVDVGAVGSGLKSFYYVTADNVARDFAVSQAPAIGPVAVDRAAQAPSYWDLRKQNSGRPAATSTIGLGSVRETSVSRSPNTSRAK